VAEPTGIGKRLRKFRLQLDLTQAQLARKLVSKKGEPLNIRTYGSYEQEGAAPPPEILDQLRDMGFDSVIAEQKAEYDAVGKTYGTGNVNGPLAISSLLSVEIPKGGNVPSSTWMNPLPHSGSTIKVPGKWAPVASFACVATDDSNIDIILPSDTLVCHQGAEPKLRKLYLFVKGKEARVARLMHDGTQFTMQPAKAGSESTPQGDWERHAMVVGIIRTEGSKETLIFDDQGIS